MDTDISAEIAKLRASTRAKILGIWQKLFKRTAPSGIRRELLVPFLAYRMQEQILGGLKPSTLTELRRIARGLEKANGSTKRRIRSRAKTGTRFIRQWHGEIHEVSVAESGYEYRGITYRSLSKIARDITGTRWSGPVFFGITNAGAIQDEDHDR
jgi:hypothetical protein